MSAKVTVLGATGMLGTVVLDWLSRDKSLTILATARKKELQFPLANTSWSQLDAEQTSPAVLEKLLSGTAWVVNAIGVIKPYIRDDNAAEVERATTVNALFPHLLARAAEKTGTRVLQIATDCVYSGTKGTYNEDDKHDALDVYGKTKSLGEVYSSAVHHLRCSIIGPEPKAHVSLLDWFLRQPKNAGVNGYTNHLWNGVSTLQFARLCHGIIKREIPLSHLQHVIPAGAISKADLLKCFARAYKREDVLITPAPAKVVIDRTLATRNDALNRQLWLAAGYDAPPSVPQMVEELATFDHRSPR